MVQIGIQLMKKPKGVGKVMHRKCQAWVKVKFRLRQEFRWGNLGFLDGYGLGLIWDGKLKDLMHF